MKQTKELKKDNVKKQNRVEKKVMYSIYVYMASNTFTAYNSRKFIFVLIHNNTTYQVCTVPGT